MNITGRVFLAIIVFTCLFHHRSVSQKVITLDRALDIAETNSPQMQQSRINLERSKEALHAQNAALKTKFSLSLIPVDYQKRRQFNDFYSTWNTNESLETSGQFIVSQPIKWTDGNLRLINNMSWLKSNSEFQGNEDLKSFYNNLYLNFNQPVFTYNRTKMQLQRLELDYENTQLNYNIARLNLEKNVTNYFYNVFSEQKRLDIAKEELNNQEESYKIIKNKVEAGLSAQEELYQAELNLASSQASLQNQQVALENAKDQFKQLLGMDIFEEIVVLADVSHDTVDINLRQAIDHALDNRMELRQRNIEIENSLFDLVQQEATNEFKGNVSLSLGVFGDNEEFPKIYDEPTTNPQVSVSLDIPIWDWGERESRIKVGQAGVKSSELSLENQRTDIVISIRQIYRSILNYQKQIEIEEKNVKNAQLTYEINLERYKNGDLTSMDLERFQNQLSQKKIAYTQALINYKLEVLNLKIQSLWDFENNEPILKTNE